VGALRSVQRQVNFICPRQAANTTLQIRTFEMNIPSRQMRHKFVQKILCRDGSGYLQGAAVAVFKIIIICNSELRCKINKLSEYATVLRES
jgi:hypothetical protein